MMLVLQALLEQQAHKVKKVKQVLQAVVAQQALLEIKV